MCCMSPMNHRNTRNPHMVAEQEFRTTTPEPASQRPRRRDSQPHSSSAGHHPKERHRMMTRAARPPWSSLRKQLPRHQSARFSRNAGECHVGHTLGKEDTAAESQSHAARTQDTLVNAVENAEVTEIIRAVFRALTRLKSCRDEGIRHDCPTRSPQTRTTTPSDTKPCHTSSGHPVFFHTSKH